MWSRRKTGPAYSLLEVVMAVGLLSLTALFVIGLIGMAMRSRLQGEQHTVATEIANDLLERVRAEGYLSIPPDARSFDGRIPQPTLDGFPPAPYPSSDDLYHLQVDCEPVADNLRRVRVTVFSKSSTTRLESFFHP